MFAAVKQLFDKHRLKKAVAPPEFQITGVRIARLLETHDGDSMKVSVVLHGKVVKMTCRLLGVDTPEIRTKNDDERRRATLARDFVAAWALPGTHEVGGMYKEADLKKAYADTPVFVTVDFRGQEKFGRTLAVVSKRGGSTTLNDLLIEHGHAVAYVGGTKQ